MARVHFAVRRHLALPARVAFDELIDWRGHAEWVPMTRVVIEGGDGGAGTIFLATSDIGPLALPDRMRVESLDDQTMRVHIVKIGPVLTGDVHLAVESVGDTACTVIWDEDVRMPVLPQFLAKPIGAVARFAFNLAIGTMEKRVRGRRDARAA